MKDPDQAVVVGAQVALTNRQTKGKATAETDSRGAFVFSSVDPGAYLIEVNSKGFQAISKELTVAAGQNVNADFALTLAAAAQSLTVSAGTVENAYRVDTVNPGGPLGNTPILDLPYSVNVVSRQLIDDTQSRNFKEAAKYLPLVSFQEMQGPEVLRPESRGMQGSNMQNDRKDGMGIAVTTPSALEEYEQIEVVTGLGGPLYGPANPSGMFNFVTKRPTEQPLSEVELSYEGSTVATFHTDLSGRAGRNSMFGYRANMLLGDGNGYVTGSQLRRQLAAGAGDIRLTRNTVIEGNYSYYNLYQHGYPGWFAYAPTTTPLNVPGSKSILLPENAPDPTRDGLRAILLGSGSHLEDSRGPRAARFQRELAFDGGRAGPAFRPQHQYGGEPVHRQQRKLQELPGQCFFLARAALPRGQRSGVRDWRVLDRTHPPRRGHWQHGLPIRILFAGDRPREDGSLHL